METNHTKGFHLDLEDYLHGLLQLSSELVSSPIRIQFAIVFLAADVIVMCCLR